MDPIDNGTRTNLADAAKSRKQQRLLTVWEEEQIGLEAPYAVHLRKIERLHPNLSQTEHRVCAAMMLRKRSWEIGQILGTAEGTVNNHRSNIRRKLGLGPKEDLSSYLLSIAEE